MSIGTIWLITIFLIPVIGLFLLRVNAATVYLSLCAGYVLVVFDSQNAYAFTSRHIQTQLRSPSVLVNLLLLLLPPLVAILSQIGTMRGHNKRLLNLLPAVATGLLAVILVVPQLPPSIAHTLTTATYWLKLVRYQTQIVGFGTGVAILFLAFSRSKKQNNKHAA